MINDAINMVESFREFRRGWNFGNGESFNDEIINDAKSLLSSAAVLTSSDIKTDAFPGDNGEIRVCFYFRKSNNSLEYLEFTLESNKKITYVHENNDDEKKYIDDLSLSEAVTFLSGEVKEWKLSELSISNIMMPKKEDSKVWLLRTQEVKITKGFPLLTVTV